jgi:hypothetical protein
MTRGHLQEYYRSVQEWSNGYRTGAGEARAKGTRPPGVIPVSSPGPGGAWPPLDIYGWPGWPSSPWPSPTEPMPLPPPVPELPVQPPPKEGAVTPTKRPDRHGTGPGKGISPYMSRPVL